MRARLARALAPQLVHSFSWQFDAVVDVKIPVTRAAWARIAACQGFDDDAEEAVREWFVVDDGLLLEAIADVEVAGQLVLNALHDERTTGDAMVRTPLDTISCLLTGAV